MLLVLRKFQKWFMENLQFSDFYLRRAYSDPTEKCNNFRCIRHLFFIISFFHKMLILLFFLVQLQISIWNFKLLIAKTNKNISKR